MGDFFGVPAAATERQPGKLFERRQVRVFSRQRSEDVQGRKKVPCSAKSLPETSPSLPRQAGVPCRRGLVEPPDLAAARGLPEELRILGRLLRDRLEGLNEPVQVLL